MKQWEQSEFFRNEKAAALKQKADEGDVPAEADVPEQWREARKRCMHLLEYGPKTVRQLEQRLIGEGFDEAAVRDGIRYVSSFGYVDDENYATAYVRRNCGRKSARQMAAQLLQKGISKEAAAAALASFTDEEEAAVRRLAQKRLAQKQPKDEEELRKVEVYLVGKGFPYELVRRTVWTYWEKKDGQW